MEIRVLGLVRNDYEVEAKSSISCTAQRDGDQQIDMVHTVLRFAVTLI